MKKKSFCEGTEGILFPKQTATGSLLHGESGMVSCGRPLQNQIVLPNYVDMRKSQSDLPKVRDKYYVHRPDKICRNQ